jgi:hypothetical protein
MHRDVEQFVHERRDVRPLEEVKAGRVDDQLDLVSLG